MRSIAALFSLVLLAASAPAPDITGTWQGTMIGPMGHHLRRIMTIGKSNGTYDVVIHSLDETDVPIVTRNVAVDGSRVTMKFDMNSDPWINYHRMYHATLNAARTSMNGMWSGADLPRGIPTGYARVAHASWTIVEPKTSMIEVAPGVRDEVLDWGGTGRPILLLAGLGNTGHDFFGIVPRLTSHYHVYSMTRRGFGTSTHVAPTVGNYSADRLGDDVMAVIDAVHIDKPVLIGHSIAGEELSDIGTRFPDKVSGLVYLDAGYPYALDTGQPMPGSSRPPGAPPFPPLGRAVLDGHRSFKGPINVPILAIFAHPHSTAGDPPKMKPYFEKQEVEDAKQIAGFKAALPNAKVVIIPNADHFVYISNTDQVLKEINLFIGSISK